MAQTDFRAVIDLGTSRLVGMVGTRSEAGLLTVLASETMDSAGCIRRGNISNIGETGTKIKELLRKLETHLHGGKIAKVYIGIGGQSVRSVTHSVKQELSEEGVVTEEVMDVLLEECRAYRPQELDVLDITSPTYYVDGKLEPNPVGVPYKKIEVSYQLIVGRPSLRRHIENSISERIAPVKVADIVISPLALADVVLNDVEKNLGCALIDFGAGVTSVSVYKGGKLVDLCVVPLGGGLITKDLNSLHLVESEAENVKLTYGSAIVDKNDVAPIKVNSVDGIGIREIPLSEVNYVVEARAKEILENVFVRLEANGLVGTLGAGVVITGGASNLKNLAEVMQKRLKTEIRYASLSKGLMEKDMLMSYDDQNVAVGLLMKADENCGQITTTATHSPHTHTTTGQTEPADIFGDAVTVDTDFPPVKEPEPETPKAPKTPKPPKPPKKSLREKWLGRIGDLFDEDNM